MARLEDLNLEGGPSSVDELSRHERAFKKFQARVEALLEGGEHDFAWGYLKDLSLTLERTGRFSAAQVEAVQNIEAGKERHEEQRRGWGRHEGRTGRRYEGFSGRNR